MTIPRCEATMYQNWSRYRCDKPGKHEVVGRLYSPSGDGEIQTIHLCGTHANVARRGGAMSIFVSGGDGGWNGRMRTKDVRFEADEINRLRNERESLDGRYSFAKMSPVAAYRGLGEVVHRNMDILEAAISFLEPMDRALVMQYVDEIDSIARSEAVRIERVAEIDRRIAELENDQ